MQVPGLAVIIVGERKDSQTYVRMKIKACQEAGIASIEAALPASATQEDVVTKVKELNADPQVHGQLPSPHFPRHSQALVIPREAGEAASRASLSSLAPFVVAHPLSAPLLMLSLWHLTFHWAWALCGVVRCGAGAGILVQLPLPSHISEEAVLKEVSLEKDVDGFHPVNIGQLAMKGRKPLFAPCTPEVSMALMLLLHNSVGMSVCSTIPLCPMLC